MLALSKFEEIGHLYPECGSLEGHFIDIANLEVQLLCVVIECHVVSIASSVGCRHHIRHEFSINRSISCSDQVVKARTSFIMD